MLVLLSLNALAAAQQSPAVPDDVVATPTGRAGVLVTWSAVAGARYYQVFAVQADGVTATRVPVEPDAFAGSCGGRPYAHEAAVDVPTVEGGWVAESVATSVIVSCGLDVGAAQPVAFRVRAIGAVAPSYGTPDAANFAAVGVLSTASNAVVVTTPATAPRQVTAVVESETTVRIVWAAPLADGGTAADAYEVVVQPSGLGVTVAADATTAEVVSEAGGVFVEGAVNVAEVRAYSAAGVSPAGASVVVRPAAGAGAWATVAKLVPVTTGSEHTCALMSTFLVRCWGKGQHGQLGYGGTSDVTVAPVQQGDVSIGGDVIQISGGREHTCALMATLRVRCWGSGGSGRLGYGGTADVRVSPAQQGDISLGGDAIQISAGREHTCALMATLRIRCWGEGGHGRLGYGGTDDVTISPAEQGDVPLGGDAIEVSAGTYHTCALMATLQVRCWGDGSYGRLGYGGTDDVRVPPADQGGVPLGGDAIQVTTGLRHTCALMSNLQIRCWGSNFYGQLGYGGTDDVRVAPAEKGDIPFGGEATQITAGWYHTCALTTALTVRCWGHGGSGRLGYGGTAGVTATPAEQGDIPLGEDALYVSAAWEHTCALLSTLQLRCWGLGSNGRLGYGGTSDVTITPAQQGDVLLGSLAQAAPPSPSVVRTGGCFSALDASSCAPTGATLVLLVTGVTEDAVETLQATVAGVDCDVTAATPLTQVHCQMDADVAPPADSGLSVVVSARPSVLMTGYSIGTPVNTAVAFASFDAAEAAASMSPEVVRAIPSDTGSTCSEDADGLADVLCVGHASTELRITVEGRALWRQNEATEITVGGLPCAAVVASATRPWNEVTCLLRNVTFVELHAGRGALSLELSTVLGSSTRQDAMRLGDLPAPTLQRLEPSLPFATVQSENSTVLVHGGGFGTTAASEPSMLLRVGESPPLWESECEWLSDATVQCGVASGFGAELAVSLRVGVAWTSVAADSPRLSYAAPVVTSAHVPASGGTLVVRGSGFGATSPPAGALSVAASGTSSAQCSDVVWVSDDELHCTLNVASTVGCSTYVVAVTLAGQSGIPRALCFTEVPTPGVLVLPETPEVIEDEPAFMLYVTLTLAPESEVVVHFETDLEGLTATPTALSFAGDTFDVPQQVGLVSTNDDVAHGTRQARLLVQTASDDADFDALVREVDVVVLDNDVADVATDVDALVAEEGAGASSFTVWLTSEPATPPVVLSPIVGDETSTGRVRLHPPQLSFNASHWRVPQPVSVSVVNDDIVLPTIQVAVKVTPSTHTISSAEFLGASATVSTFVVDDDVAALVLPSPATLSVVEGFSTEYGIQLASRPSAPVTVAVVATTDTPPWSAVVAPSSVEVQPQRWNATHALVVTVPDDEVKQGPRLVSLGHSLDSADADYGDHNGDIGSVVVSVADDEANQSPGVRVEESSVAIAEGSSALLPIRLSLQPTHDVNVFIASAGAGLLVGGGASQLLSFSPNASAANAYNVVQHVELTYVEDEVARGARALELLLSTVSNDAPFNGLETTQVVSVSDNDEAAIVTSNQAVVALEGEAAHSFRVWLKSKPSAPPVTVFVALAGDSRVRVSPSELVFGASDWTEASARSLSVLAVNDEVVQPTSQATIVVTGSVSSASNEYADLSASVSVVVVDDDAAGVVTPATLSVTEGGSTSYAFALRSRPTALVNVSISVDYPSHAMSNASSTPRFVVFEPHTWNMSRSVRVAVADDDVTQGSRQLTVGHVCDSVDADYASDGQSMGDIPLTVADNERRDCGVGILCSDDQDGGLVLMLGAEASPPMSEGGSTGGVADDDSSVGAADELPSIPVTAGVMISPPITLQLRRNSNGQVVKDDAVATVCELQSSQLVVQATPATVDSSTGVAVFESVTVAAGTPPGTFEGASTGIHCSRGDAEVLVQLKVQVLPIEVTVVDDEALHRRVWSGEVLSPSLVVGLLTSQGDPLVNDTAARDTACRATGHGGLLVQGAESATTDAHGRLVFPNLRVTGTPGAAGVVVVNCTRAGVALGGKTWRVSLAECARGQVTRATECVDCAGGFSWAPRSDSCAPCPAHTECPDATKVLATPGYWRATPESTVALECPTAAACVELLENSSDAAATVGAFAQQCADGYSGRLCHSCASEHGRMGTVCVECWHPLAQFVLLVIGSALLFGVVALMTRGAINDAVSSARRTRIASLRRLALSHLQVLSMAVDMGVNWPVTLDAVYGGAEALSAPGDMVLPLDCWLPQGSARSAFASKQVVMFLSPFIAIGIAAAVWTCIQRRSAKNAAATAPSHSSPPLTYKEKFAVTVVVVLYTLHPTITRRMAMTMACTTVEDQRYISMGNAVPENATLEATMGDVRIIRERGSFLNAAPDIECTSDGWRIALATAFTMLTLAIPAVLLLLLRRATRFVADDDADARRSRIALAAAATGQQPQAGKRRRRQSAVTVPDGRTQTISEWTLRSTSFLQAGYRRETWGWELVVMAKKSVLSAIIVFTAPLGVLVQAVTAVLLLVGVLVATVNAHPYEDRRVQTVDVASLMVQVLTLLCALYFEAESLGDRTLDFVAIVVAVANVSVLVLVVWLAVVEAAKQGERVKKLTRLSGSLSPRLATTVNALRRMSVVVTPRKRNARRRSAAEVEMAAATDDVATRDNPLFAHTTGSSAP